MAISRNMMERQLRAGGGIMTLEEPRQGYFLGKIVKKAKRAVKKVVKSPFGKAALFGGLGAFGLGSLGGGTGFLGRFAPSAVGKGISSLFGTGGKLSTIGNLFKVGGKETGALSIPRLLGGLGIGSALAAPFLMGGDEEEIDEGIPVSGVQPMVADIRNQAQQFYRDPAAAAASGLFFMPQKRFVQPSFYAANGGLADIPREGYNQGEMVEGIETVADDENMMMAGMGNVMRLFETPYGFDRAGFEDMLIQYEDSGARGKGIKLRDFAIEFLGMVKKNTPVMDTDRVQAAEGGMIDMGGLEKDYREGGFVPIGAEERADDVPARLSKNEFVFTADAVRNAGGGDIDKGAEVMQNMMDNLESGGTISEESQGMENPAQEMFDQAQQLESRIA